MLYNRAKNLMKKLLFLVTVVSFIFIGCQKEDDIKSKDLWGTWKVTSIKMDNTGWINLENSTIGYYNIIFSKDGSFSELSKLFGIDGSIKGKNYSWKLKGDIIQVYFYKSEFMKYDIVSFDKDNMTAYFIKTVGNNRVELKIKK